MQALDAVTLTGNPQTITLPLNLPQPTMLLFGNESPYAISVRIAGYQRWIHAWTADIMPIPRGANAILSLTPVLVGSNTNSPSATVLLSVADPGETIPGTYPINLDRLTSLSAGSVSITAGSVSISGTVPTTVTNTPNVAVTGTPNVAVTNTPTVTANAGTGTLKTDGSATTQPVSSSNLGVTNTSGTNMSTNQPQVSLGDVGPLVSGGADVNVLKTVPVGTHVIAVVFSSLTANIPLDANSYISVVGNTTSTTYAFSYWVNIGGTFLLAGPIMSAVDTQIKVIIHNVSGVTISHIYVVAILDSQLVGAATASGGLLTAAFGGPYSAAGLRVTNSGTDPAPWQAAWSVTQFAAQLAGGANSVIIAATTGGQRIYLHSLEWHWTGTAAAAFGYFEDSSSNAILQWNRTRDFSPFNVDFKGVPLGVNTGFRIRNASGTAMVDYFNGCVCYSIST